MERSLAIGPAQRMKSLLRNTMPRVTNNEQRLIEKYFFSFAMADIMLFIALPAVTVIPKKAVNA